MKQNLFQIFIFQKKRFILLKYLFFWKKVTLSENQLFSKNETLLLKIIYFSVKILNMNMIIVYWHMAWYQQKIDFLTYFFQWMWFCGLIICLDSSKKGKLIILAYFLYLMCINIFTMVYQ